MPQNQDLQTPKQNKYKENHNLKHIKVKRVDGGKERDTHKETQPQTERS